jgi:hypothetical protein
VNRANRQVPLPRLSELVDEVLIVTDELFAAAVARLETRRTRTPDKRYQIDWPLKRHIRCATCNGPMTPHMIRYRTSSTAITGAVRPLRAASPCGHQVSTRAIEMAVVGAVRSQWRVDIDPKAIPNHASVWRTSNPLNRRRYHDEHGRFRIYASGSGLSGTEGLGTGSYPFSC